MGWTEERVDLLKRLWMEGLSASQIAAELGEGITRNAVIGKVHRLKLSGRAKPASSAARARSTPRPARRPGGGMSSPSRPSLGSMSRGRTIGPAPIMGATALKLSEQAAPETYQPPQQAELEIPVDKRLSLLQLSEQTCKWPIGDPLSSDFYFCGGHALEGKPYCEFHSRRAYHQVDRKRN